MEFRFNIDLTDKDYTDFNIFWQTKSRYGKKILTTLRIFCWYCVLFLRCRQYVI